MPRAVLALALLIACAAAAWAQAPQKQQMLLIPLKIDLEKPDGFESLDPYNFYQTLEQKAEQAGAQVDLVIPGPGDPRLEGFDLTQEPDAAAAAKLGQRFEVPLVAWTKIEFRLQSQTRSIAPTDPTGEGLQTGDPAPENLITVGGIARIGAVDVATGKTLVQGPVAIFRSSATRANQGTGNFQDDVRDTALQCADDLAGKIVEVARKRRASQPGAATP